MKNTHHLLLGLVALALSGCMSTRQIQTSSPRPVNAPGLTDEAAGGMGLVSVDIVTGSTALPPDIQALRFRLDEVRLRTEEGEWLTFPAELNSFEILQNRDVQKTILTTRVQPLVYDSLALKMSDVFVLFDENAGAPLTLPKDKFFTIGLGVQPAVGTVAQLRIAFEPGASLMKDVDCHWYFVPFWKKLEDQGLR